ncbi:phosphatidylethanolamine/phosphatidyl-N-methylethanolamine N-methyltransferase [Myxococcaceae bacterium]|jgi:phospholipid N-methyltransferase|nr:phosphatidylethanolamine/phosphatidyl-N-methylethanolamine N-methyltransferase [Myxococcaceae bacterium]
MSPISKPRSPSPEHRIAFFQAFLRKPKEVGSIIPSSRFLMRRVVREARVDRAKLVVELGPGTGGSTRALLRTMRPDAKLLAIEINPRFARLISQTISDPRLVVHVGSAEDIAGALRANGLPAPDVVLSGIPFSTMPRNLGLAIIRSVHEVLRPNGRFVAYQVRDRVEILGRQVFGPGQKQTELLNVPPMRVYRWEKAAR